MRFLFIMCVTFCASFAIGYWGDVRFPQSAWWFFMVPFSMAAGFVAMGLFGKVR